MAGYNKSMETLYWCTPPPYYSLLLKAYFEIYYVSFHIERAIKSIYPTRILWDCFICKQEYTVGI